MPRSPKRRRLNETADTAAGEADPSARLQIKDDSARCLSKAQQNMAKLWRNGSLCDVEIAVEGQTFQAHRMVLAAGSDYMSALFCEDRFKDSTEKNIELGEMSAASFERILEWFYEGKCDFEESESMDLLEAASRLQCVDLVPRLENIIVDRLVADTCLKAWDAADRMQLAKLAESAEAKALECYEDLAVPADDFENKAEEVSTRDFEALSAAKLSRLLASDQLKVKNEEAVYESVISWTRAQSTPPSADELHDIFDKIRFPLLSEAFITDHVETEQLVLSNPKVFLSLFRSMKEKAYGKRTTRTSFRICMRELSWEDIRTGLRVRVKDDLELVKALCKRPVPGANEAVGWCGGMEVLIGSEHTIEERAEIDSEPIIDANLRSVLFGEFLLPFDALERAL